MDETTYGLRIALNVPYVDAVAHATEALKAEGVGVLTRVDVQQTLKAKLNRDFRKYVILGACNPPLADRALHAELEIGLLLPCNVVVYETGPGSSVVAAMAPLAALGMVGDNAALTQGRTRGRPSCGARARATRYCCFGHRHGERGRRSSKV